MLHPIEIRTPATTGRRELVAALTPGERDVVRGLARGRAPKQLAAERGVSLATIRAHIQNAKRKTRARTLAELVAIATRCGAAGSR